MLFIEDNLKVTIIHQYFRFILQCWFIRGSFLLLRKSALTPPCSISTNSILRIHWKSNVNLNRYYGLPYFLLSAHFLATNNSFQFICAVAWIPNLGNVHRFFWCHSNKNNTDVEHSMDFSLNCCDFDFFHTTLPIKGDIWDWICSFWKINSWWSAIEAILIYIWPIKSSILSNNVLSTSFSAQIRSVSTDAKSSFIAVISHLWNHITLVLASVTAVTQSLVVIIS